MTSPALILCNSAGRDRNILFGAGVFQSGSILPSRNYDEERAGRDIGSPIAEFAINSRDKPAPPTAIVGKKRQAKTTDRPLQGEDNAGSSSGLEADPQQHYVPDPGRRRHHPGAAVRGPRSE